MKYLIRTKGKNKAAHIWTGQDTVCRMWSTGGIDKRRMYDVHDDNKGLRICHICEQVHKRNEKEDLPT